jgi:perosamine synthetase
LIRRGVKLVFADILESTLCIDPLDVRSKMTSNTKAIVQVHLGGIEAKCGISHVPIVSDACQALGMFTGTFVCCSFQAIKHFTTGDGGMLICLSPESARDAKLLRWFGIDREKKIANNWQAYRERKMTFDIDLPGTKRHMTDIAAAMGLVGLDHYDRILAYRRKIFGIYRDRLENVPGIRLVDGPGNVCWLATVIVEDRDEFAKMMFEAGIDTNVVQVRNDIYKIFGGERQDLPVMNAIEEKYLSIPIGMHITEDDAHFICDQIRKGW